LAAILQAELAVASVNASLRARSDRETPL